MERCKSNFCTMNSNGTRGREFNPPENGVGIQKIWCPDCIRTAGQVRFYTKQTGQMVKNHYLAYMDTALPKDTKNFLTQFVREILIELGDDLDVPTQ